MSARVKAWLALLLLSAVAIGFAPAENTPSEPTARPLRRPASAPMQTRQTASTPSAQALQLVRSRASWPITADVSDEAASNPTAPFAVHDWAPPPPPPPPAADPVLEVPELPYTYLGKQQQNGNWQVFLGSAQGVMIVKTGDILEARYRVDSITPAVLTLMYLPLNLPQTLAIQ